MKKLNIEKVNSWMPWIIIAMVILQPILDLDYLLIPLFDAIGLPRLSTIFKFILIPLTLLSVFVFCDKKKKQSLLLWGVYGIVLAVYFVLHVNNATAIFEKLDLTTNFYFSLFAEITYFLTLLIPLIFTWAAYKSELTCKMFKLTTILLSCIISIPIFIGNIFTFGLSTYSGSTQLNFLSWFTNGYELFSPRQLCSKFYFVEGNTVGILMFMLLPLLFYYLYKEAEKKRKIALLGLIAIHTLAMIMLGTRVATYGAILMPAAMFAAYFVLCLLKKEKFEWLFSMVLIAFTCISALIYPYSPAYQNQLIDAEMDAFVKGDDYIIEDHRASLKGGEGLVPGSKEFNHFYIHIFEDNAFLISSTPKQYYLEWYYYQHDPKFWVDYIFNYPLEARINGRQFQKIFMDYKHDKCTSYEKVMGMGYSTFMNGSIVLEKDFEQQIYTMGYFGASLLMLPWLIMGAVLACVLVVNPKKRWNLENVAVMLAAFAGLGAGYISGHTMDQYITSLFIALCFGYMWTIVKGKRHE